MDTLRDLGENPEALNYTWCVLDASGGKIYHAPTIEEEAWTKWTDYFFILTGRDLPDDAPVITE